MEIIVLKLNDIEKIVVNYFNDAFMCEDLYIQFISKERVFIVYDNIAHLFFDYVNQLFPKCLENKAQLHESINQDIGFMWNEHLQRKIEVVEDSEVSWVGMYNYLGCKTNPNELGGNTWMYNDEQGNIVLKMTPTYTWTFREPEPGEDFVEYEEWIKSYKPMLIRTIPHDVLQRWYDQIKQLEKQVQDNERKAREQANESE